MNRLWMFLSFALTANLAHAFLLVNPNYRLAKPEETTVNIASGGCRANGITNSELEGAIAEAIKRYWNTVTESRLNLKVGGEVPRAINHMPDAGEILVGCGPLTSANGVTYPIESRGGAVIVLNSNVFVPGGYLSDGLLGVLSHEMGHAVGLNHSGDPASVMTYESHDWGPAATHLAQDDKDGVVYLYPREAQLGGLLGGCQALAGPLTAGARPGSWALFELSLLLGVGHLLSWGARAARRLRG
ncbi:MAG TPA: matrixin family metalloprotease [Bdellovibrionales bacterium]|nr:matrixin family metalloprotease [Bdellovibrionales bacterium]